MSNIIGTINDDEYRPNYGSIPRKPKPYSGPVKTAVEWITPERAELWLIHNTHNRNVNETIVKRIARDIENENFHLNGETIKISDDGTIIDGQHRLWAIVGAETGVWSVVVTGLPLSAQESVDRVKVRNISDALRMRGEVNSNVLAGAIAGAIILQSPTPSDVARAWPSVDEALEYYGLHPEIKESVRYGENLTRVVKTSSTIASALHHIFAKIDEEDANAFFDSLTTGLNLTNDSPVYKLRDFMVKEMTAPRRVSRTRLSAFYIKAWNSYRAGKPMHLLRWATGGVHPEEFPRPE